MFSYSQVFANKQKILFVTAHPDDIMVYFGGLLVRLIEEMKDIFCSHG